jgi:hypothetical protein
LRTKAIAEKVASPAWKSKPRSDVAVNERMLPPEYEQAIANRINARTVTPTSGHGPMLSMSKEIAAVIVDAATEVGAMATAGFR